MIDIEVIHYLKLESNLRMEHGELSDMDQKKIKRMRSISNRIASMVAINLLPDKNYCRHFKNCHYLPNIPIGTSTVIQRHPENRIIFIGSMTQNRNFKEIDRFIDNLWLFVKQKNPDIEFHIIDKETHEEYREKWQKNNGIRQRLR